MRSLAVMALALVACKQYDEHKLLAVCSAGTGYDAAATYDPNAATTPYPLAMIEKNAQSGPWFLTEPERFKPTIARASKDNYKDVSLALCVEQQPGPFARDCSMGAFDATVEVGDHGSTVTDTHKTGTAKVKAYASHYVLTMREAKTGKVVATKALDVKVEECPTVVLGDSSDDYVEISDDALAAFAASALPKAVGAKLSAK